MFSSPTELIHNLALLVLLSVLSDFIRRPGETEWRLACKQGLLFGSIAVIGMMQPLVIAPGVLLDVRSIVIGLCALFFGPVAVGITAVMAMLYRILVSGAGLLMGLWIIFSSAALGLYFRRRWVGRNLSLTTQRLLLFGLLVHATMVVLFLAYPWPVVLGIVQQTGLPILVGYPLFILLIGKMLARQEAQARNADTLHKVSTAVAQSPVSVVITDTQGTIEYVNPKFTELTGYTLEEAKGQNPRILKSGELQQEDYQNLWGTITAGGVWRGEFHNRKKNGELYWELASISPIRNAAGVITSFVAVKEDITHQKQVAEELRSSEAHYRALEAHYRSLVEGMPGIVYVYSTLRGGLYYPPRVVDILGRTPEELYAQPMLWHNAIHPEDLPRVDQCIQEALAGKSFCVDYRIRDAQNRWHWFEDRSTEIRVEATETIVEGFVLDITERKQAEQARLEMERKILRDHRLESLGVLAGSVAHEFNNILTSILGNAEVTRIRLGEGHPLRKYAENTLIAGRRARDLVQKILQFSRQDDTERPPLLASQAMEDVVQQLRAVLPSHITLRLEGDAGTAAVFMDRTEMQQVLMHLCMNALQVMANAPEGVLTLSVRQQTWEDKPSVAFEVGDTGPGIPPEIRDRIFEPFFTTKGVHEGAGLGLSVVHGILKRAGGHVDVESEVGVGSRFRIVLQQTSATSPAPGGVSS